MYDGTHAITFGPTSGSAGKHTWNDWFLIPTSRPTMSLPGAQNRFVEIPGMDGSYDLSDYLNPEITYSDRTGSFEFIVDRDKCDWRTAYRTISTYLHGQRLRMILTDEPEWYYEGRFTVDQFTSDPKYSKITIKYRVYPFKMSIYSEFADRIQWDPFNFDFDYDWGAFYHVNSVSVAQTFRIYTPGELLRVRIKLVSGGPVTASFGGITQTVSTVNSIKELGKNNRYSPTTLTISGTGVIDVGWRRLSL